MANFLASLLASIGPAIGQNLSRLQQENQRSPNIPLAALLAESVPVGSQNAMNPVKSYGGLHPSFATNNPWKNIIVDAASTFGLNPNLIAAVIQQESSGNINARSPVGALGLMQLMPATAARFGVKNPRDPVQNIMGGAKYLKFLMDKFQDPALALAGYNAGEGAVMKYGGIPPYKQTQDYVKRIMANLSSLR